MLAILANSPLNFTAHVLLAAPGLSIPWAIVILCIAIGLAITLSPSGRTSEIKRSRDE